MTELSKESSPYLRLHSQCAVKWTPWQTATIEKARREAKLLFVVVGYYLNTDCHETELNLFSIPAISDVLNERFISVKVDRDEMPIFDFYFHRMMFYHPSSVVNVYGTDWPRYLVVDPKSCVAIQCSLRVPDVSTTHAIQITEELLLLEALFKQENGKVAEITNSIKQRIAEEAKQRETQTDSTVTAAWLDEAVDYFKGVYDERSRTLGGTLRFWQPSVIQLLFYRWGVNRHRKKPTSDDLDIAMNVLTQWVRSRTFDHIDGGFFRSRVGQSWQQPRFEKHLAFNGYMLALLSDAAAITHDTLMLTMCEELAQFLVRDMQLENGGFQLGCAEIATSEHFYTWTRHEVKRFLDADEMLVFETLYGIDKRPNFGNRWLPERQDSWNSVVDRLFMSNEEAHRNLQSARTKLSDVRKTRKQLLVDRRVFTANTALAIHGLARAASVLQSEELGKAAFRAVDYLREAHVFEGCLLHTRYDDGTTIPANFDDHALLLAALMQLLTYKWRSEDSAFAKTVADDLIADYVCTDEQGFVFKNLIDESGHTRLRPMDCYCDSPPAYSAAVRALLQLSILSANEFYREVALNALASGLPEAQSYPIRDLCLLESIQEDILKGQQVILRGPQALCEAWQRELVVGYQPWRFVYVIPYDEDPKPLVAYLPRLVSTDTQNEVTAFVCSDRSYSDPLSGLEDVYNVLR